MTSPHRLTTLPVAALGLLALTLSLLHLGRMPLLDPDEARYAQTSKEMIERGDWIVPRFNGDLRLKKPPLFHWEQIAAFQVFGVSEFSARLPSALAYLALVAALVAFAWSHAGKDVALPAGAILVTFPMVFVTGRGAVIDMSLTFFVCSALLLYYGVDSGRLGARPGALLVGLSLGLAVLAKGPVGVLAPVLVIGVYHAVLREWGRFLAWRGILLAAIVAIAAVVPWLVLVLHRVGYETFERVAMRETVERYVSTGLEHPHGPFFYFMALPLAAFPWSSFLLPAYLPGIFRDIRSRDRLGIYLWVWIAGMFVFFSLGRGKLVTYILPALPAVALYLARAWGRWSDATAPERERRTSRVEWGLSLAILIPTVVLFYLVALRNRVRADAFLRHSILFLVFTAAVLGVCLALCAASRRRLVVPALAAVTATFFLVALRIGGPELERTKTLKTMVDAAGLAARENTRLCVYQSFHPSLVYYTGRHVERVDDRQGLLEFLRRPGAAIVVMDVRSWDSLGPRWQGLMTQVGALGNHLAFEKRPDLSPDAFTALTAEVESEKG